MFSLFLGFNPIHAKRDHMKVVYSLAAIVFSLMLFSSNAIAKKPLAPEKLQGTIRVDAEAVVDLMVNTPNLVIIDTRKDIEYMKGHIQGSINMLDTKMTVENLTKHVPDKSTPILLYCNGERCLRSSRAAVFALDAGYKLVYWFRGGWNEWVHKGMPISNETE